MTKELHDHNEDRKDRALRDLGLLLFELPKYTETDVRVATTEDAFY